MALQRQQDLREYTIFAHNLATAATVGVIVTIPIPRAGNLVRVYATEEVAHTVADTAITFEIGNVLVLSGGATATLTIPFTASAIGKTQTLEITPGLTTLVREAEDGDLITAGSVLEVISDGGGTAGSATFAFVIRP